MPWAKAASKYIETHGVEISLKLGTTLLIILAAWIVGGLLARWAARALKRRPGRGATLASATATGIRVFVVGLGVVMGLDQIGVDVGTLLAGAGILGLAVGFGAQSLVKDVISGFFLIFDEALSEGDIADVGGGAVGVVESVGLRMTQVRSFSGQLWYVQNGEIRSVGNFSRTWTRAVVEVGLAYEQDVAKGLKTLQEVGDTWAKEHDDIVLEPPEAQGVLGLNSSDVGVRLVIKVKAPEHFAAERELRARVKAAFDAAGVEIPFPRQVVYHRQEEDEAPLKVGPKG